MKKNRNFLLILLSILIFYVLSIGCLTLFDSWITHKFPIIEIGLMLLIFLLICIVYFFIKKEKEINILSKVLVISNALSLSFIVAVAIASILSHIYICESEFSISTTLFDEKNVMVFVPHQDDDINLVGGLIEQYTENDSQVTVVFTTNGDSFKIGELRATEVTKVLTSLGVKKENIYYLGFGERWTSQMIDGKKIGHIYDSTDPNFVWTSLYGAKATYDMKSIKSYLKLPYTRNNYVHSIESIIEEKMPDTVFAVDFDSHMDHRASGLLFEEAMCEVLRKYPNYKPTVYKGFCYGTAWSAVEDLYDNINLQSTKKPKDSVWNNTAFCYDWENRVRFPVSRAALKPLFLGNSIYESLDGYSSQHASVRVPNVLNGDKVFWERRTDSLLYNAEVFVGNKKTFLLNDFKLKDFDSITDDPLTNTGVEYLNNERIYIRINGRVKANSIYLYDNCDKNQNILEGYISFSDGSRINFNELAKDGSPTKLLFKERDVSWLEIVVTKVEGNLYGLSEIELYYDEDNSDEEKDKFIMAVDSTDNFVYDYIVCGDKPLELKLYSFPNRNPLSEKDVKITYDSTEKELSYNWENDTLVINCKKGNKCKITVSKDNLNTTFTVYNVSKIRYLCTKLLRNLENITLKVETYLQTL